MKRFVYMKITKDRLELPVVVADSPSELARILGVKRGNILSGIYHARERGQWCQYIKVEIEEEEE